MINLTHPFADGMPVFPGLCSEPSFRPIASVPDDGYAMTELHLLNHVGTHVDAPAPSDRRRRHAGRHPARAAGHAPPSPSTSPTGHRAPSRSRSSSHRCTHLHPGDILSLCSDNARNWGTAAYWTGWSYPDAQCAQALVDCGISAVGFDGPSADPGRVRPRFDLHRLWLASGRMIIENLTNLTELPTRSQVVVAPIKLARGNGGPARIFALLPDEY